MNIRAAKPVVVIAEAGVNHNGSLKMALDLVEAAAAAGADIIKFQTFRADLLASPGAPKAAYQTGADSSPDQLEMLRALELDKGAHLAIKARADARGIEFLSTPFDSESLAFLASEICVERIKLGSGEITNGPFLLAAARTGLPIILSTGLSTLGEIESALGVIAYGLDPEPAEAPGRTAFSNAFSDSIRYARLRDRVTLLHCTSQYPAPPEDINLRAIQGIGDAFGLATGLSDHSLGIHLSLAAVACGAVMIEKHFTLDQSLPGPDHRASILPGELVLMVKGIREIEMAMGDGRKVPRASELTNSDFVRRGLVAARAIKSGAIISTEDIIAVRPAVGLSPMAFWDVVGTRAKRSYEQFEPIDRGGRA